MCICAVLQPLAQRPAIVLKARRPVATAPDESAWKTAQLPGESAGRTLQEASESRVQLPGAPARLQSHPLPHASVSTELDSVASVSERRHVRCGP